MLLIFDFFSFPFLSSTCDTCVARKFMKAVNPYPTGTTGPGCLVNFQSFVCHLLLLFSVSHSVIVCFFLNLSSLLADDGRFTFRNVVALSLYFIHLHTEVIY